MMINKLTAKQRNFCRIYVESMGDKTAAIKGAFNIKNPNNKNLIRKMAHDYLKKPHIINEIHQIMNKGSLNDCVVDVQLLQLIQQNKNLSLKAKGVEMYNKMKNRYAPKAIQNINRAYNLDDKCINEILQVL